MSETVPVITRNFIFWILLLSAFFCLRKCYIVRKFCAVFFNEFSTEKVLRTVFRSGAKYRKRNLDCIPDCGNRRFSLLDSLSRRAFFARYFTNVLDRMKAHGIGKWDVEEGGAGEALIERFDRVI